MTEERLLTVREVARRCHRSEETIRRWIWSGKLPARKLGNQLFVEEGDVDRIRPELRTSEPRAEYQASAMRRVASGMARPLDSATKRLFEKYGYSPTDEYIRQHQGQSMPSKEEALRQIVEDKAFQERVLAKFGPVNVVDLLRQVRED